MRCGLRALIHVPGTPRTASLLAEIIKWQCTLFNSSTQTNMEACKRLHAQHRRMQACTWGLAEACSLPNPIQQVAKGPKSLWAMQRRVATQSARSGRPACALPWPHTPTRTHTHTPDNRQAPFQRACSAVSLRGRSGAAASLSYLRSAACHTVQGARTLLANAACHSVSCWSQNPIT